jgi:hypothetical protein
MGIGVLSLFSMIVPMIGFFPQTVHAAGEKTTMGMPFSGKWAYNAEKAHSTGLKRNRSHLMSLDQPGRDYVGLSLGN